MPKRGPGKYDSDLDCVIDYFPEKMGFAPCEGEYVRLIDLRDIFVGDIDEAETACYCRLGEDEYNDLRAYGAAIVSEDSCGFVRVTKYAKYEDALITYEVIEEESYAMYGDGSDE